MKKEMVLCLALVAAVVVWAACQPAANVGTDSSMNQNMMNRNSMANGTMANHNGMMNSNQSMSEMMNQMKSDPNAANAPYDLQFIDTMSMHHRGAIAMAQMALKKSTNEELKKFAQKIIDDQNAEIAQMKDWRDKWFKNAPGAMNMEMSGMMESLKMMMGDDEKKMETASGKDFDLMFLDTMTPHHQGAVTMAKDALTKAQPQEIKTLANQIIKAQDGEIKQMQSWKDEWSKK